MGRAVEPCSIRPRLCLRHAPTTRILAQRSLTQDRVGARRRRRRGPRRVHRAAATRRRARSERRIQRPLRALLRTVRACVRVRACVCACVCVCVRAQIGSLARVYWMKSECTYWLTASHSHAHPPHADARAAVHAVTRAHRAARTMRARGCACTKSAIGWFAVDSGTAIVGC